jgi:inorganic triphosphatase YgiF
MDTQREVEVKLGVPAGFVAPHLVDLAGVHRVAVRTLRLRATYWDTEDRRLARGGLTLRHRTGEGRPRWTLKTASSTTGSGLDREEISVPGPGTRVPRSCTASRRSGRSGRRRCSSTSRATSSSRWSTTR